MAAHHDIDTAISANTATRHIAIIAFEGVEVLDVAGPASVFSQANILAPGAYDVHILASRDGPITTSAGFSIATTTRWDAWYGAIDTLIVAGGSEAAMRQALLDGRLGAWIARAAACARRIASICTGAFALAQAGLLHGRKSTTHWSACELLQRLCPQTSVVKDCIFVQDGPVWTSAGVLTGMDLALTLVEHDLGREIATQIANRLVMSGWRSGGESQKSTLLALQAQASVPLRELLAWMNTHLHHDLSVDVLAQRVGMSPRHFARVFRHECGLTPARCVQSLRLERSAALLRETRWNVEQIAETCGFDCVDALQRAFVKRWSLTPSQYRRQYAADIVARRDDDP